ncbi:MAG TPA: magnesium transporter, partial [Actinomycetes bacterium]
MSGTPWRVFIARLAGVAVFDPNGDQVGRVRDVVVAVRGGRQPPRVLGLVVEVPMRRRIFLAMTRVTALDAGQVITTGVINMRRFEQRIGETLVLGEMFDRKVQLVPAPGSEDEPETVTVVDVAMEQTRTKDWEVTQLFVRRGGGGGFRRRGGTVVVDWAEVSGLAEPEANQGTASLLATYEKMRPADLARALHDLSPK